MLNKRWLAGAVLGAFLTVTAGAFAPQAEASALTPTAIKAEAVTVELAKHPGDHKPPKHDKKFDKKHHKHDKKFDKKHDKKHDKHKKHKKFDKKRDKHKKHDRHDRHPHGKPMPPRR